MSRTEPSQPSRAGLASRARPAARSRLFAAARGAMLAGVCALALAACNGGGGNSPTAKAMKPLSPEMVSLIEKKDMSATSPIVVRIFKEESELEVWKQTKDGDYALLKTYPICRWSGELGPKVTEGDRQAPEGFYTITPGQMNPNSSYYLAFNMGYPNAYDKAWGRTGAHLMVHGDCSSSGCYAMTDEQISEIFALGRDSFTGGQRSFQVQAYPFRMTPTNMARHRNNPNMPFWRMIKEGYDTFEITKAPPKVDVCEKRYVFNATPADPTQRFNPTGACPAYTQPAELEGALASKRRQDDTQVASIAPRTPIAPVKTGTDGGMHKVFLAKLQNPDSFARTPGTLPQNVRPPSAPTAVEQPPPGDGPVFAAASQPTPAASAALANGTVAAGVPAPLPRPTDAPGGNRSETVLFANSGATAAPTARVASIDNSAGGSSSFFSGVTKLFGGGSDEPTGSASAQATAPAASGSSGFSFGKLFGQSEEKPAAPAAAAPVAMASPANGTPAAVPVPLARPTVPAAAAAPRPVSAAPAPQAARPAPAATASAAADQQPLIGTPALPGAPILSTGGFSQ